MSMDINQEANGYKAIAHLYHAFMTGLVLTIVSRKGAAAAAQFVFRLFRHQHEEKFLPGLKKLGLEQLPDAVSSAQYHYLSNVLGTVKVEYMYESDRKAWIRYPPPRWIWHGTAICGIPSEVSAAMMHGWHGQNGVSLGNPKLGFVCTGQTVDGQPGLEGYFYEYDHDLQPDERVRFVRDEQGPDFDLTQAPELASASWPLERLQKVERSYAMEYLRSALPELLALFGPAEARFLIGHTANLIGMQYYDETAAVLDIEPGSQEAFAQYMQRLAEAQGETIERTDENGEVVLRQTGWKLMRNIPLHEVYFDAWNCLWEGALAVHNRHLRLTVTQRFDQGDEHFGWRFKSVPR